MESLIANFVQYSCAIARILFDPKSEALSQLAIQLVLSASGDNNLVSFPLWSTETVLKLKRVPNIL